MWTSTILTRKSKTGVDAVDVNGKTRMEFNAAGTRHVIETIHPTRIAGSMLEWQG